MSDDLPLLASPNSDCSWILGRDLDEPNSSNRQRVLVIEDDPDTILLLKNILRMAGFAVLTAVNGQDGLRKYMDLTPDIILLDLMMPEMDGWETLRYLREMSDVPVIIISAIGSKENIVQALKLGADDYIVKPVFITEVVARIQVVMHRAGKLHPLISLVFPKIQLTIDLTSRIVTYHGKLIHLMPKEFAVLTVLGNQAPEIVDYYKISTAIWGEDTYDTRKRTQYLIYLMRPKFGTVQSGFDIIQNINRLGYMLKTEV